MTKPSKTSSSNRIARALDRVSSEPTERGCLLWEGAVDSHGYGRVGLDRRRVLTHRLAWAFGLEGERHGAMPPPEVVIRHRCDNPRCNSPDHLQAGSKVDNSRDMVERGRSASGDANGARRHPERRPRGEEHVNAKLSDAAVAKVRELRAEGLLQREIAVLVGCSRPHVSKILRGVYRAPFNPKEPA
jgi:hypothetical protein